MDQHPVPQNISSYEFRLVGDMTLKQFLMLAGGAGAGLVIFRLPLPVFIKWPLVVISVLTGILMAFVPIQGRPFAQWLFAFIKAIYAPTEFYWNPSAAVAAPPAQPAVTSNPVITPDTKPQTPNIVQASSPPPPPVVPQPPKPTTINQQPSTPLSATEVAAFSTSTLPLSNSSTLNTTQYATAAALPSEALAKEGPQPIPIPQPKPVEPTTTNYQPTNQVTNLGTSSLTPTVLISHTPSPNSSTSTPNIPPPTLPNILAGLVVSSDTTPQEGAIVEIVANATGLPVRALRTNKTGLFQIATPLPNGEYSLYTDKDGLSFDSVSILTDGKIIQPIIIKAK